MEIECLDIRGTKHDVLKAIARIKIKDWGMIISDVKLMKKEERYWAALPSKMYEQEGEKKYYKLIQFEDKKLEKQILKDICDAIMKDMKIANDSYEELAEEGILPF